MAGPNRLEPSDDPKVERLRASWRKSYAKHRDEKVLKAAMVKPTEEARVRAREKYQAKREAALLNGPAPRPIGRPRASEQQRLQSIIIKAEKTEFWEVAAALRVQLDVLVNTEANIEGVVPTQHPCR